MKEPYCWAEQSVRCAVGETSLCYALYSSIFTLKTASASEIHEPLLKRSFVIWNFLNWMSCNQLTLQNMLLSTCLSSGLLSMSLIDLLLSPIIADCPQTSHSLRRCQNSPTAVSALEIHEPLLCNLKEFELNVRQPTYGTNILLSACFSCVLRIYLSLLKLQLAMQMSTHQHQSPRVSEVPLLLL